MSGVPSLGTLLEEGEDGLDLGRPVQVHVGHSTESTPTDLPEDTIVKRLNSVGTFMLHR